MAISFTKQTYKGAGRFWAREAGTTGALTDLGNITQLEESTELSESTVPNLRTCGGGSYDTLSRVTKMSLALTGYDFSTLFYGIARLTSSAVVTATTLTGEALGNVTKGGLVAFANAMSSVTAVNASNGVAATAWAATTAYTLGVYKIPTVANGFYYKVTTAGTTAGSEPTWPTTAGTTVVDGTVTWTCQGRVLLTSGGTDYDFTPIGIIFAADAQATDGEPITYSGPRPAQVKHSALKTAGKNYELIFEGLNCTDSARPMPRKYFNVKIFAAETLALISEDEYASIPITGEVLPDASGNYVDTWHVGGA